jgi:hypothetical protein
VERLRQRRTHPGSTTGGEDDRGERAGRHRPIVDDAPALRVSTGYNRPVTRDWLVHLEDIAPTTPPEVEDPAVRDSLQQLTARLAREPESWASTDEEDVRGRFDARATDWATRDTAEYRFPLVDALARGGALRDGRCLEIGSGTGIQTPTLLGFFDSVVALDLSFEMLRNTAPGRGLRVRADASHLPLPPGSASAVVCVNAFLFAPQYVEALEADGAVVFVSTRADRTPIYLPPVDVVAALREVDPAFQGVTARAGQGCWTVARRA